STSLRGRVSSTRKSPEAALVEATATHELKCDLAADVIRRFGILRLRVTGFSMLPSIWPGTSRVCRGWPPTGPEMSSYLAAKGGCLYTGSSGCRAAQWLCVGTPMLDADPPVAVSDVLGRVEAIERGGSRVAMAERVSGGRRAAG